MTIPAYIKKHRLYEDGKFVRLYEEFILGDWEPSGRRYTDSMTFEVERMGELLIVRNKVGDVKETIKFVECVLEWSGPSGRRVHGQLFNNQTEKQITDAVAEAAQHLLRDDLKCGDLLSAIKIITDLKGLGISYGSKILRMLAPKKVGVMDSFIQEAMSYPMTPAKEHCSWVKFCGHCKEVADILSKEGIENRFRISRKWHVADVEAAIYRHIDKRRKMGKLPRKKRAGRARKKG